MRRSLLSGVERAPVYGVGMMLLLAACTDDALLLGEKHENGSDSPDASHMQDAPEGAGDAGDDLLPLKARFQANGHLGVVRIETPCITECVEVTVVVEGGVPPYEVVWDDGKVGATQMLCPDRARIPSVAVSDNRPGGGETISLALNTVYARACGSASLGLTCFVPERMQVECAGKRREVFDLGASEQPGTLSVQLECEPAKVLFIADATFSETPCREEVPVYSTQLTLTAGPQQSSGGFSVAAPTGQFLTFAGISAVGLPRIEDSIEVDWIEVCAYTNP